MKTKNIEPLELTPSKSQLFIIHLLQNKKKLFTLFFSLLLVGMVSGLSYSMWNKTKTKNVSNFEMQGAQFGEEPLKSNLKKFQKIAARFPTLQSQLDASLAQQYLNLGETKTSKTIWKRVEKRQGAIPFLERYNEVTFLIEEQKYFEALEKSYPLKEELKTELLGSLYIAHMVRLIALEEKVGHQEQKVKLLTELNETELCENQELSKLFNLGNLKITDYL